MSPNGGESLPGGCFPAEWWRESTWWLFSSDISL